MDINILMNKFKNNSQSTAESFEKFGFYKDKLFDLFKL